MGEPDTSLPRKWHDSFFGDGGPKGDPAEILRSNSYIYEWLVNRVTESSVSAHAEEVLHRAAFAASFAARFHPGRFSDGALENVVLEIGARDVRRRTASATLIPSASRTSGSRRILHVTSSTYRVGGHSRMLHRWIQRDSKSRHSVLVTDADEPPPEWLQAAIAASGGSLVVLPKHLPRLAKARTLREAAIDSADLVVLHHLWSDVVPVLAFAGSVGPPVAILNHADHVFWLGNSVGDLIINLRSAANEHARLRRSMPRTAVLPVPVDPEDALSKASARESLGISKHHSVFLSVGRPEKYRPCGPYDFVQTANKLLRCRTDAHVYVVGETLKGIKPFLRNPVHERLHFLGTVEDPSLFRAAADVYLESFPFGSQTALLEGALAGLPAVPAYDPLFALLVTNDDSLLDLLPSPADEAEYIQRALALIDSHTDRSALGDACRRRLLETHTGAGWLCSLEEVYRRAMERRHEAREVPVERCVTSRADIGLSLWSVMTDGRAGKNKGFLDSRAAPLRHAANAAKQAGFHSFAAGSALRALIREPFSASAWRLLGAVTAGRAVPRFHRAHRL